MTEHPDTVVPLQVRRIRQAVYAGVDLERPCPTCHAEPGQWCTRPDGATRRLHCVARMQPPTGAAVKRRAAVELKKRGVDDDEFG
jgi:hypothetical protein